MHIQIWILINLNKKFPFLAFLLNFSVPRCEHEQKKKEVLSGLSEVLQLHDIVTQV